MSQQLGLGLGLWESEGGSFGGHGSPVFGPRCRIVLGQQASIAPAVPVTGPQARVILGLAARVAIASTVKGPRSKSVV